jgi:hypothetical protein
MTTYSPRNNLPILEQFCSESGNRQKLDSFVEDKEHYCETIRTQKPKELTLKKNILRIVMLAIVGLSTVSGFGTTHVFVPKKAQVLDNPMPPPPTDPQPIPVPRRPTGQ